MLHLIAFLNSHSWEEAKVLLASDAYGVDVRDHEDGRTLFKYNQFTANLDEPLVAECRGIILDRFNNWEVVSFPFVRFYHHNQERAAKIDWKSAVAYEKLDGSCCTLYFWKGSWRVQLNKQIEADHVMQDNFGDGSPNAEGLTFADKFWEVFRREYSVLRLSPVFSYMFELCTKLNKVITEYNEDRLVLIGARYLHHGLYDLDASDFDEWFEVPRSKKVHSIDEAIQFARELNENSESVEEGVVVRDHLGNRIKIKNPEWSEEFYKRYQKTESTVTSRANLMECIMAGDHPEFLDVRPEFKEIVDDYIAQFDAFSAYIEEEYEKVKDIEDQKKFAQIVSKHPFKSFLFGKRNYRKGVKRMLEAKSGKTVLEILNKYREI